MKHFRTAEGLWDSRSKKIWEAGGFKILMSNFCLFFGELLKDCTMGFITIKAPFWDEVFWELVFQASKQANPSSSCFFVVSRGTSSIKITYKDPKKRWFSKGIPQESPENPGLGSADDGRVDVPFSTLRSCS